MVFKKDSFAQGDHRNQELLELCELKGHAVSPGMGKAKPGQGSALLTSPSRIDAFSSPQGLVELPSCVN